MHLSTGVAYIQATPGLGFDSCHLHAGAEHPLTSPRNAAATLVATLLKIPQGVTEAQTQDPSSVRSVF